MMNLTWWTRAIQKMHFMGLKPHEKKQWIDFLDRLIRSSHVNASEVTRVLWSIDPKQWKYIPDKVIQRAWADACFFNARDVVKFWMLNPSFQHVDFHFKQDEGLYWAGSRGNLSIVKDLMRPPTTSLEGVKKDSCETWKRPFDAKVGLLGAAMNGEMPVIEYLTDCDQGLGLDLDEAWEPRMQSSLRFFNKQEFYLFDFLENLWVHKKKPLEVGFHVFLAALFEGYDEVVKYFWTHDRLRWKNKEKLKSDPDVGEMALAVILKRIDFENESIKNSSGMQIDKEKEKYLEFLRWLFFDVPIEVSLKSARMLDDFEDSEVKNLWKVREEHEALRQTLPGGSLPSKTFNAAWGEVDAQVQKPVIKSHKTKRL